MSTLNVELQQHLYQAWHLFWFYDIGTVSNTIQHCRRASASVGTILSVIFHLQVQTFGFHASLFSILDRGEIALKKIAYIAVKLFKKSVIFR